jgi:hypothetical protein
MDGMQRWVGWAGRTAGPAARAQTMKAAAAWAPRCSQRAQTMARARASRREARTWRSSERHQGSRRA